MRRDRELADQPDEDGEGIPRDEDERSKLIEHLLCAVEDELSDRGKSNEFIESLRDQFDRKAWLTDNQIAALKKFYARAA